MHDVDDDHVEHCQDMYEHASLAMAIWAAAHPSLGSVPIAATALGTHLAGDYFCNGGSITDGQPGSYADAKLGYDPATDAPPAFALAASIPSDPNMDIADHTIDGDHGPHLAFDHAAQTFDYAANQHDCSPSFVYGPEADSSEGFDYSGVGFDSADYE